MASAGQRNATQRVPRRLESPRECSNVLLVLGLELTHVCCERISLLDVRTRVERSAEVFSIAEWRLGAEPNHVELVRTDEERLSRLLITTAHVERHIHAAAVCLDLARRVVEPPALIDHIHNRVRFADRAGFHLVDPSLRDHPIHDLTRGVDVKRGRRVPHAATLARRPPVQHAGARGLRSTLRDQVAADDDDGQARVADVLGRARKGHTDPIPVKRLRGDVARHVDDQRHAVVKLRHPVKLSAVDGLVRADVPVAGLRIEHPLVARRQPRGRRITLWADLAHRTPL
mmetsp:Transcript_91371/g.260959  ORF Transcript_91371/g.260959 Transcript_91371/m.260959 type:complete len:287 (-) Transcript_91371:660-1520(-)